MNEAPPGICPRCGVVWDAHCFKCEPVVLCPVLQPDGSYKSPCQKVGPQGVKP